MSKNKKTNGSAQAEQDNRMLEEILKQMREEIVEQLRIQNKIQSIAVEALLDKKRTPRPHCGSLRRQNFRTYEFG